MLLSSSRVLLGVSLFSARPDQIKNNPRPFFSSSTPYTQLFGGCSMEEEEEGVVFGAAITWKGLEKWGWLSWVES